MTINPESVLVCQPEDSPGAAPARVREGRPPHAKFLGGSIILLLGSVFVSLANFGYNIGVARTLGPSDFSHAAAAVTILMLVSAITLAFQLVCTKLVAKEETIEGKASVYQRLRKRAWAIGMGLGVFMLLAASVLTTYLRLSTPWIIILLAVGLTIYVPLGVKRGGLQGTCRFKALSWNMVAEAVTKFAGAMVLIELGFGVLGAVAAISFSVVLAYLLPDGATELRGRTALAEPTPVGEALQAIVFFVGQVIISNIDILMVKHFFRPDVAGLYAAIALVGRLLYFGAWSIVSAMFPVSAESKEEGESQPLLALPLLMVTGSVRSFRPAAGGISRPGFPVFVWRPFPHRDWQHESAA